MFLTWDVRIWNPNPFYWHSLWEIMCSNHSPFFRSRYPTPTIESRNRFVFENLSGGGVYDIIHKNRQYRTDINFSCLEWINGYLYGKEKGRAGFQWLRSNLLFKEKGGLRFFCSAGETVELPIYTSSFFFTVLWVVKLFYHSYCKIRLT